MVVLCGIILIGGHFFLLVGLAHLIEGINPTIGLPIFLLFSTLTGLFILRVQTWLEILFIRRHIRKNPHSSWNVVSFANTHAKSKRPKIVLPMPDGLFARAVWLWGADVSELVPQKLKQRARDLRIFALFSAGAKPAS